KIFRPKPSDCICLRSNISPTTLANVQTHLGPEHLRQYQLYLLNERKLSVGSVIARTSALRFFFLKVLRRPYSVCLMKSARAEALRLIFPLLLRLATVDFLGTDDFVPLVDFVDEERDE